MTNKMASIIALSTFLLGSQLSAATIYSGTIDESDGRNSPTGGADFILDDFNTNPSNPDLTIGGNVTIFGYVAHKAASATKWADGWSMDFGTEIYNAVFNWQRVSSEFDGTLTVGTTVYTLDDIASGSLNLGPLTGSVAFSLNPIVGSISGGEKANWNLQAIAPVPLPASTVLLLTGLAGFGALRRSKKI